MKKRTHRPGRDTEAARAASSRRQRYGRWLAALAACAALLLAAAPAQALTGGAAAGFAPDASPALPSAAGTVFGSMQTAGATWYGPGLYGRRTACGLILRPDVIGVAHRTMPCGTVVKFAYRGRTILATVIDRGPYAHGVTWDLTNGARLALGLEGSAQVRYAVPVGFAQP